MSIRNELLALQGEAPDGVLHCSAVIEWARENTDSSLHSAIEWRNKVAADAYRLHQVRQLISLHIGVESREPTVVSLSIDRQAGGGYRSLTDIAKAPTLQEVMLRDALDELERLRRRYARVQELSRVWEEAAQVEARAPARRKRGAVSAEARA